jgi:hypothetical protein
MKTNFKKIFQIAVALIISSFIALGCANCKRNSIGLTQEQEDVFSACERWLFLDLSDTIQISILHFDPSTSFGLVTYSNFLIGTTVDGDTLAFIDFMLDSLGKNKKVLCVPYSWSSEEIDKFPPLCRAEFHSSEVNSLYIKTDTIFYSRIVIE